MRIGEFAKKYGINASAIRFYVDKAILTPKRANGLYIFDRACEEQMERIMRYKKCGFSLEEIEVLCYYERTTRLRDEAVNEEFLQLFHDKEIQMRQEIREREEIIKLLREEVSEYRRKAAESQSVEYMHVPVEALGILHCPECGKRLPLKNAEIGESGVICGEMTCECGYEASVFDGMIICGGSREETPFKAFENIDSILAITDDFSPAYRNLIDKAHLWMYQCIAAGENEFHNVMAGPFAYNFILKHLEALPDEALYIIVDVSIKKLRKLQRYFGGSGKKILYIAGALSELPLKKECVDLYIDDFSSSNYIFTYSRELLQSISPFIKEGGMLAGQFVDYSMAPKSLENFRKDHDGFKPEMMKNSRVHESFKRAGIKLVEESNCGSTQGNKRDFARNVVGEQVSVVAYCARKQ